MATFHSAEYTRIDAIVSINRPSQISIAPVDWSFSFRLRSLGVAIGHAAENW